MEFKANHRCQSAHRVGCAVVGVYENGELGNAARHIDATNRRNHQPSACERRFCREARRLRCCCRNPAGAAAARVLLAGLGPRAGFERKPYRKALRASGAGARQDRRERCRRVSRARGRSRHGLALPRPRGGRGVLRPDVPNPDLKTGAKPKPPKLALVNVASENTRGQKAMAAGLEIGAAIGAAARSRAIWGTCRQYLYATYIAKRGREFGKRVAAHQDHGARRGGHQRAQDGGIPRGDARLDAGAAVIVSEYRGAKKGSAPICLWARASPSTRAASRSRSRPRWTR